ncbi:MAG: hypothetical protein AAF514_10700, partial [Verrucomicrobiota bacterium]
MKYTQLSKSLLSTLVAGGLIGSTMAGEMTSPLSLESAPPPPVDVLSSDSVFSDLGLSFAVAVGYDNEYIWRGSELGKDLTWFDVSASKGLTDDLSFTLGLWQASWRQGDELDIYASLDYSLGPVSLSLGWIYYYFYGGGGDYNEYSLGASTSLGPVDLGLTYYIAPESGFDYSYVEFSAETSFGITDRLSLDIGAAVGYGDEDFISFQGGPSESSMTHVGVTAGMSF